MGWVDVVVIVNEFFQGLVVVWVILEVVGGKICKFDGCDFYLNEYLNGYRIDDYLLVVLLDIFMQVRDCLMLNV